MVRVFADDIAQTPIIKELIFTFAQMQRDLSTALDFFDVSDGVITLAF